RRGSDLCPPRMSSLLTVFFATCTAIDRALHSFPTRRSSDLEPGTRMLPTPVSDADWRAFAARWPRAPLDAIRAKQRKWPVLRLRSEEHTSELQSLAYLVCRLLLEKKKGRRSPACT